MKHRLKTQERQKLVPAPPPAPALPPAATKPLSERLRKPGLLVLSGLIALFYFWTATSSNRPFHVRDTSWDLYDKLATSMIQGHLYLPDKPSPKLLALPDPYDPADSARPMLLDASLYRGRYYLYFGVAPVAVLYVPWQLLTGKPMSDDMAITILSFGGFAASCLLLFLLFEVSRIRVPWYLQVSVVLALGLGQIAPIVLRRPRFYEVAVAAGYCFLLGGLYCLARQVLKPHSGGRFFREWSGALGGVLLGLAVASRPHLALVVCLITIGYAVFLFRPARRNDASRNSPALSEFSRFAVPLAVAAVLIGWYNYARFENPLEFGIRYQLTGHNFNLEARTGRPLAEKLRVAASSLYYGLFSPPDFIGRFPFFELRSTEPPFGSPNLLPQRYFVEPSAGALLVAPLCLVGLLFPLLARDRKRRLPPHVRSVLGGLWASGLTTFAAVCTVPGASGRYALDYVPVLLVVGLFLCVWLTARTPSGWLRATLLACTLGGCLWGAAINTLLSVNSYCGALETPYSPLFRSIASFFGAGPAAWMGHVTTLQLDATVAFPDAEPGRREVLLTSGLGYDSDLFYINYGSRGQVALSYLHGGHEESGPYLQISPGKPYQLAMDYSVVNGRMTVRLDGEQILSTGANLYPTSRDRVVLGESRTSWSRLRDFSGQISARPGGLRLLVRETAPPVIYTSSPREDSAVPRGELLNYNLAQLLAHSSHMQYGREGNTKLPTGVFEATTSNDHFATPFLPLDSLGPHLSAVEITVTSPAFVSEFGRVNLTLQDQGFDALCTDTLPSGQERILVALPEGAQSVRLAFLPNVEGYIRLPDSVRLRAFANK